jgi:hypothetical protein
LNAGALLTDECWIIAPTRVPDGAGGNTYTWDVIARPLGRVAYLGTRVVVENDQRIVKEKSTAYLEAEDAAAITEDCGVITPDLRVWEVDGLGHVGEIIVVNLVRRV